MRIIYFSLQPFQQIRYELVGVDKALNYFEVDSVSGDVRITASLSNDVDTVYRVSQD